MCMSSIKFMLNLRPNDDGDFVGVGFKSLPSNFILDKTGRINYAKKNMKKRQWSKNWKDAFSHSGPTTIKASRGGWYQRGFHIFLNMEDARKYESSGVLVRVEFKNVLAFGNNPVRSYQFWPFSYSVNTYGPCIISQYMRIVEVFE